MSEAKPEKRENEAHIQRNGVTCALFGYCVESLEAATRLGYDIIAVVPPGYDVLLEKDGINAIAWEFDRLDDRSHRLAEMLEERGAEFCVPLYEETVEWVGAVQGRLRQDPRIFSRYMLLRDKAMMKRRAQMAGIRVGVFEEVDSKDAVRRFFQRVNDASGVIDGDKPYPIHVKPTTAAGSVGHYMLRSIDEIDRLPLDSFPCMAESHLDGQEFSCEVFVHGGQIAFMNINEYIHLGYSQLLPPTPELEKHRPRIREAIEHLIRSFDIQNAIIHPEYFIDAQGELNFGEVAARIPGGHIFQLIERAYGFDPFAGQILCSDPTTSMDELEDFFPDEVEGRRTHAGNLLVYPKKEVVTELAIPRELDDESYYLGHNLFEPVNPKVAQRAGFGDHYGKVDFAGEDPHRLKELLLEYEEREFYV